MALANERYSGKNRDTERLIMLPRNPPMSARSIAATKDPRTISGWSMYRVLSTTFYRCLYFAPESRMGPITIYDHGEVAGFRPTRRPILIRD